MPDLSIFDLSGKHALVTGGSVGIGRAAAIALATAGADVAIVDLDATMGEKTAAVIRDLGRRASFIGCDITEAEQVDAAVQAAAGDLGSLDIAVNNAGIFRQGTDGIENADDWDRVIAVNLTGVWRCAHAEMRQMSQQDPVAGKIVNIGSIAASVASISDSYGVSKAGVVHLTRTLAVRWGPYNINVNSVSPGYVGTVFGMTRSLEERQRLREITPLGHIERLADLRGAIVFLASEASDYITGQNLVVDGGHTLSTWISPLERKVPPRVDPAGEAADMKQELEARGILHDEDAIVHE